MNMFKNVRVQDTAGAIAEQVIQRIRDGLLKPGDRLPNENDLMEQFGVGRSSVREAKRVLATKGVIEMQAGRGTFIRELGLDLLDGQLLQALLGKETLLELQEARNLLEHQIVSLATQRATEQNLQQLEQCLIRMVGESPEECYKLGLQFHQALAAATHNRVLMQLYDVIAGLLSEYQRPLYVSHRNIATEIHEHQKLLDAVRNRDIEQACQLMAEHMSQVTEFMLPFFENSRRHGTSSEGDPSHAEDRNFSST
jgi:GntR family transcriptional repressor for pyruvate dehydrogenase complex